MAKKLDTEVLSLLVAARKKIESPSTWTQGANARDAAGYPCEANSEHAVCFCSYGAIDAASATKFDTVVKFRAAGALYDAARSMERVVGVAEYNDGHSHAEVLALFDAAIAEARAKVAA